MAHSYGLYPWHWNATESCHEPPQGAFAVIDLRPVSEQAVSGQSGGWGFFAWPDQVYDEYGVLAPNPYAVPVDLIGLGYGDCRELQPTTGQREELRIRLGLPTQPAGATLVDVLNSSVLGELADPTGQNGPKPNMPTREGTIDLHLAYHSRVWSEAFAGGAMFATTTKGKANRIRDVIRGDLETAHKSGGPELVAKVLGLLCDRWGVSYAQAAKWRNLIRGPLLAELLGKSGGKFAPKKPRTSYSDDFNRASLGSDWTSVAGTASITLSTVFELASGPARRFARYEFDVSSSDHWCQILQGGGSSTQDRLYPCVRFSPSAQTCYRGEAATSNNDRIVKTVAGTNTNLSITSGGGGSNGTYMLDVSGSALELFRNAVSRTSTTDTAITGNTRGGIFRLNSAGTPNADNWSIDDGVSAGGQPMALRTAGMRLGWARVGRGF